LISAFKRFNSTEVSSATEAKEVANEQTKADEQDAKVAATEEVKQEYAFGAAPRHDARQGGYVKEGAYGDRSSLRPPPPPNNTVYVGNLVFDMTSADLAAEFQDVGKVVSAVVAEDARGLSKGYAFLFPLSILS
jgi:nucleolin